MLEGLVDPLGLSVAFGVVTGGEVKAHVQGFPERAEEVRNELRTPIGGDVGGNSVLGKDVGDEQVRELRCGERIVRRDEDGLLGQPVYDDEDGGVAVGVRELLDEVHRDGVPRTFGDRELFQRTVREVARDLGSTAGGAGLAVVPD